MEIEHMYNENWIYNIAKKHRDYFLEKLGVEGAERVVIVNSLSLNTVNSIKNPKGSLVNLGVSNNGVSVIVWYKDGKVHRENEPAYETYYEKICTDSQYYYEGNWCYNVGSVSSESMISSIEMFGSIVLSKEIVTNKVLHLKLLSKDRISDKWYYIPNGV